MEPAKVVSNPTRRWRKVGLIVSAVLVLALIAVVVSPIGHMLRSPLTAFDPAAAPPAPDYAREDAWLALPGGNGLERSTPTGVQPIDEASAPVDVFFIHPTTWTDNGLWNAPYSASNEDAPLNTPVLLEQLSTFNGCCRLYAPQYRQATLAALRKSRPAVALAYSDVRRAFQYFIAHQNDGRPFIIASHSQGTGHAVRLLQEEIVGTPLQSRMVAAYLIGGYVQRTFPSIGLPICDSARQTGCVVSYNTGQVGRKGARMVINHKPYWWQGAERTEGQPPALCVNPLTWTESGTATAAANPGSVPFPKPPFPGQATSLPLVRNLTGATCADGMLDVDIPPSAPSGFRDTLTFWFGSYHLGDYGIFYLAIRRNAMDRVKAWLDKRNQIDAIH